jgi:methylthioribose-1-phosphate isomerase
MKVKALERIGNRLRLLDQTKLPESLVYLDLDNYKEIIAAIKRLSVRGAPAIGIAAAYGLAVAAHQTEAPDAEYVRRIGEEIKCARPTAVNLAWAVDRVLGSLDKASVGSPEELRLHLWSLAEKIHEEDREMCARIGRNGATLIQDDFRILTHCNAGALATGGIGTALGVVYTARDQGKKVSVYADETRPLLQGARLTAWELQHEGINVTLVTDSTAAVLMRQGRVNCAIVGADRIAKNGDTANKIGTYSVAQLCKAHGIPFYVAAPSSTFDQVLETGDQIVIEERAAEEITEGFGRRTAPDGVKVYAPAFDVTPSELVTAFITDEGIRVGGRGK